MPGTTPPSTSPSSEGYGSRCGSRARSQPPRAESSRDWPASCDVGGSVVSSLLVDNIGLLVTADPSRGDGPLGTLTGAALVADGETVAWVGPRTQAPPADDRLDAAGGCVLPGFVDSHSHLVFGGDRSAEFYARMAGWANTAGGIRITVAATRAASDETLAARARSLVAEALTQGTTTIEIKSGYGLTVPDEARCLQ